MTQPPEAPSGLLDISGVERETGLSKDVLRVWERRYGFPKPERDENGERQYTFAQVAKLRAIKRLMDVGVRPGKIVGWGLDELNALAEQRAERRAERRGDSLISAVERSTATLLREHDAAGLRNALAAQLMRHGMQRFVLEIMAPLNRVVGEAWMRGELQIFEEHLYTEQLQTVLRAAINALPRQGGRPRVLLTTLPGEQHALGLLMVEALLASETAQCISLGAQTPLDDVRRAALGHRADIVALSFSSVFPVRQASEGLATLRRHLPAAVAVWAGGEMTRRVRRSLAGVTLIPDLAGVVPALNNWYALQPGGDDPNAGATPDATPASR
jgi:DNA-binding transcriptional MerR regulator/methylmalonyl-CoA mutase cobalamin-binding subunit